MQKNPFIILGVSENADTDELYAAYKKARSKYESMRFEPGEKGAEACARLDELDQAYRDAQDIVAATKTINSGVIGDEYERADTLLKAKRYSEAQEVLNDISDRSARWYYLQSIIHYASNDLTSARDDLRQAVNLDPGNNSYATALNRIEMKIDGKPGSQRTEYYAREATGDRSYRRPEDAYRQTRGCGIMDVCSGLCLADCCCECMGGDLISCC
ncbi:MAG: hypothetical protein PHG90_03800 [Clostridia bacterium]|jgi:molecular chaperone DnaJ|nr:hypothetical protein [Clostridia bacterium]